jgi:hypothetical protein
MMHDALIQLSKTNAAWHIPRHEIHQTTDIANHVFAVLRMPKLLLDSGVDPNEVDNRGRTALFEAIESFSLPLVKLLLSRGANATHVARNGGTPMQLARMHGLAGISTLLVEHGALLEEDTRVPKRVSKVGSTEPEEPVKLPLANSREIPEYLGGRCDFDILEKPLWSTVRKKYIQDHPRPLVVRRGFRQQRRREKKKKKRRKTRIKEWVVPKVWNKGALIKSRLGKIFVAVGDLPYGNITAPDSFSAVLPMKRFLRHHLQHRVDSIEMKMGDEIKQEQKDGIDEGQDINDEEVDEDDMEARSRAYLFDPNILNNPIARPLLAQLESRRSFLADEEFRRYVNLHQLSIGPHGSGAPVHFHEGSFSTQVSGEKLWAMWSPGDAFYTNVPSRKWWTRLFDNGTSIAKPLLCIQRKGDVVYVPPSWSHFTMVLSDESYSIADSFSSSVFNYLSPLHRGV